MKYEKNVYEKMYIALYCILLYTQSALQSCGGGGGGSLLNHHHTHTHTHTHTIYFIFYTLIILLISDISKQK